VKRPQTDEERAVLKAFNSKGNGRSSGGKINRKGKYQEVNIEARGGDSCTPIARAALQNTKGRSSHHLSSTRKGSGETITIKLL